MFHGITCKLLNLSYFFPLFQKIQRKILNFFCFILGFENCTYRSLWLVTVHVQIVNKYNFIYD